MLSPKVAQKVDLQKYVLKPPQIPLLQTNKIFCFGLNKVFHSILKYISERGQQHLVWPQGGDEQATRVVVFFKSTEVNHKSNACYHNRLVLSTGQW